MNSLLALLLVGCIEQPATRIDVATAELLVCSPDGGRQVLVADAPDGFPEGALLDETACATFELPPGTWFIQVSEPSCQSPWEEVEVTAPVTEHTVDFSGCLG